MRLLIAAAAAILAVVLGIAVGQLEYGTEKTVTFTVKSLDDQSAGSNGHQYLVFTTDSQVFGNTDSLLHGKTDSSSIQAWLTPDRTYRCPVYGFRLFWASSYPDILDGCTDITPGRTA